MAILSITAVEPSALDPRLEGFAIEQPEPGSQSDLYALDISGWVIGAASRAQAVVIDSPQRWLRRIEIDQERQKIAAGEDVACGFAGAVGVPGLPENFELKISALLEDGDLVPLGVIRGRHEPVVSNFRPRLQPIMVTSLGRSGTTLLMGILSAHPSIVVHRDYPYETRAANYFLHALRVLGEPANPGQSSAPDAFQADFFSIGQQPFNGPPLTILPRVHEWLRKSYVEELARFLQERIDELYLEIAASQSQGDPGFFAEKTMPNHIPRLMWELYPQGREVILVRDFRDMICSIDAFNAKRGFDGLALDGTGGGEDFVERVGRRVERLLEHWHERRDRALLLRYEDLVLEPEATVATLLDYLGLEAPGDLASELAAAGRQETPGLADHRTSKDVAGSIGRWQTELDERQAELCDTAFESALDAFGYR